MRLLETDLAVLVILSLDPEHTPADYYPARRAIYKWAERGKLTRHKHDGKPLWDAGELKAVAIAAMEQYGAMPWRRGRSMGLTRTPSYDAALDQVKRLHGPATEHHCQCGNKAQRWAYTGDCSQEQVDSKGRRFSMNPGAYKAMCRKC